MFQFIGPLKNFLLQLTSQRRDCRLQLVRFIATGRYRRLHRIIFAGTHHFQFIPQRGNRVFQMPNISLCLIKRIASNGHDFRFLRFHAL
jgi:hypothetical protein